MLHAGLQGQEERWCLFKMTPEQGLKARPDLQGERRQGPLQVEGCWRGLQGPGVERAGGGGTLAGPALPGWDARLPGLGSY